MVSPWKFILSVLKCFTFKNVRQKKKKELKKKKKPTGEAKAAQRAGQAFQRGPGGAQRKVAEAGGRDGAGGASRDDHVVPEGGAYCLAGQVTSTPAALSLRPRDSLPDSSPRD